MKIHKGEVRSDLMIWLLEICSCHLPLKIMKSVQAVLLLALHWLSIVRVADALDYLSLSIVFIQYFLFSRLVLSSGKSVVNFSFASLFNFVRIGPMTVWVTAWPLLRACRGEMMDAYHSHIPSRMLDLLLKKYNLEHAPGHCGFVWISHYSLCKPPKPHWEWGCPVTMDLWLSPEPHQLRM